MFIKLYERLKVVLEHSDEWYAWWITKNGLITVGKDDSGGDHYGTFKVVDDPGVFGISKSEIENAWSEEDGWISDDEAWMNIVNKVMSKNIRIGLNSGELYMDFPDESNKWLPMVQKYNGEITVARVVTIEISSARNAVSPVSYNQIPANEFWSANKLNDLRAYRDV